jgi:hypothetical protein
MKKITFVLLLTLFYFLQSLAQRQFGLSLHAGLSEGSIDFWLWLALFIVMSLVLKPFWVGLWIWSFSKDDISMSDFDFALRENIRAIGSILTYGLFLILPGLWRYLELFWVPWIVYLSLDYKQGKLEAFQASKKLFTKHKFGLFGLIILVDILIPLLIEAFLGVDSFSSTLYLDTAIYSLVFSLVAVFVGNLSYRYFQKIKYVIHEGHQ